MGFIGGEAATGWEAVLAAASGTATAATTPAAQPANIMTAPRASACQPLPAMEGHARSASTWTPPASAASKLRIAMAEGIVLSMMPI